MTCMWSEGVFLGVKATSGEYTIGSPGGVEKTRTVARKPFEERWNPKVLDVVGGVPWRLSKNDPEMDGEAMRMRMSEAVEMRAAAEEAVRQMVLKRMYIKRSDLQKWGTWSDAWGAAPLSPAGCSRAAARLARNGAWESSGTTIPAASPKKENTQEFLAKSLEENVKQGERRREEIRCEMGPRMVEEDPRVTRAEAVGRQLAVSVAGKPLRLRPGNRRPPAGVDMG